MKISHLVRSAAVAAGLVMFSGVPMATVAQAAERDFELIESYQGDWRGRGTASVPGQGAETVLCNLSFSDAGRGKLNFKGNCALAAGRLAMNGTMAYIQSANRYEAIMTTNTSYGGLAIGTRRGNTVDFRLQTTDETNTTFAIKAGMSLAGGGMAFDFAITNLATGQSTTAKVPFEKL